jgi:hypothetical protein
MPTYPTCVFCNRSDSKPSKEELLAKWIAREFPDATWEVTREIGGGQSSTTFSTRGHFGAVSRKVCKRCNNTWMSNLESLAKPILKPMIHGDQTILSRDDQLTLARWMTKSAVVYDTHGEINEYFFTEADCHTLFTSSAKPFPDSTIHLARYDETSDRMLLTETRQTGMPQSADVDQDHFTVKAYSATFVIKHLALQVFALRRHEELRKTGPVQLGIADFWRDRTICIWPLGDSVMWPPRISLDMTTLTHFVSRWRSPDIAL